MEPITLTAIAVLASLGAGFGAGWGLKPDAGAKAIEAQTEAIKELNSGNEALVTKVQEVAVEDAKRETAIADKLTDMPPPCIKEVGGDPMSLQCMWALCIRLTCHHHALKKLVVILCHCSVCGLCAFAQVKQISNDASLLS